MKQVMVFIDGSNLYHGLREAFGRNDINMGKLVSALCGPDRELVRAYYYIAPVDQRDGLLQYKGQQKFLHALHLTPDLQVVLGRLEKHDDGTRTEKGVDVSLAVDMLSKAYKHQYDVAILVSGDGDFAKVIQEVKDAGRKVEVAYLPKCYHVRVAADRFTELTPSLLVPCWLGKNVKGLT